MSLPVIEKLQALVKAGGVIVGPKPIGAQGLAATDEQVLAIADEMWGAASGTQPRNYGKGRIHAQLADALRSENIIPDVTALNAASLHWAHRLTPEADIYFVSNQSGAAFAENVAFRITGRNVEIWDAVTGSRMPAAYESGKQTTSVPIALAPHASQFVVFRGKAQERTRVLAPEHDSVLAELNGEWNLSFVDGMGAPRQTRYRTLGSWTDDADPAVRYYSGRVVYEQTLDVPEQWLSRSGRIELDLGAVGEMARVRVNGTDLGVVWSHPFKLDVTDALRPGRNRFEIIVTNFWLNRLVGDKQPGAVPVTFTVIDPYDRDTPLRPSGLVGPVRLIGVSRE